MAKYFTANKIGLYLLMIIVIQPITFNMLNIDRSTLWSIIGHIIFILIGVICLILHWRYHKSNENHGKK